MRADKIDGTTLARLLKQALAWLQENREEINALNVFPVPDGDTGTNMCATLEAAVTAIGDPAPHAIDLVAAAAARGALIGARGNSGVILSQIIHGFAAALKGKETAGVEEIAAAIAAGADYAYQAVGNPVEGTILTVVRETAAGAQISAHRTRNLLRLLAFILRTANRSLAQTPEFLPSLKEAGVVDAGGRGFTAILEGALQATTGKSNSRKQTGPAADRVDSAAEPPALFPSGEKESINYTYCTEFLVKGPGLNSGALQEALSPYGDCLLVVGEGDLLRVHIHTDHPGIILEAGLKYGSLHNIRISNMRDQHREKTEPQAGVAVVAVAAGAGFTALFTNLGAAVVPGGQTMNPSTGEIAAAAENLGARTVIILPNNPNILLAARQVQNLTRKEVLVVPTTTMPQGLAALLAFKPEAGGAENASRMAAAAERVVTAEITRAFKEARIEGKLVKKGDFIALCNDKLLAAGSDLGEVALTAIQKIAAGKEIVTLYYGQEVEAALAQSLATRQSALFPETEIEVQFGGQPYYHFLIAAE